MPVKDFLILLRIELKDMNKLKYSDFDLITAINFILRLIYNALIRMKSSLLNKFITLDLIDNTADLPTDFITIVKAIDENGEELYPDIDYYISGNKIFTNNKTQLNILYRAFLNDVQITDNIPIPMWLLDILKKFIKLYLNDDFNKTESNLFQIIYNDVSNIISGREYSVIERPLHFEI